MLLLFISSLFSQTIFEELENRLKTQTGKERIETLQNLALSGENIDLEKAIEYAKQAVDESNKANDNKLSISSLKILGNIQNKLGRFNDAISCFYKGINFARAINDKNLVAEFNFSIGLSYYKSSDYHKALGYYLESFKLIEKTNNKELLSLVLNNLGIIYSKINQYDNALKYYLKSLNYKEDLDDKVGIARTLVNIGVIYQENKNYEKAIETYTQSLNLSRSIGLKMLESINLNNIGNIYQEQNNPKHALEYHQKALKIRKELNDQKGIANSYNNIGNSLDYLSQYAQAYETYQKALTYMNKAEDQQGLATTYLNLGNISVKLGDLQKAKDYLQKCITIVEANDMTDVKGQIYYSFSIMYSSMKNFKKSDEYFRKYRSFTDSLYNSDLNSNIAEMQVRFETEKKEKENQYLKLENEAKLAKLNEQRRLIFVWIIISILLLGLAVALYKFYISKKHTSAILERANLELEITNNKLSKSEENLKNINATKDKFFSIIAHDLRNPFFSLLLSVETLKKYYDRIDRDQLERIITTIGTTVNQSNDLLTNLLEWARAQTNGIKYQPEMVHLVPVVLQVLPLVKGSAFPKNIKIETDLDNQIIVFADLNMLNTILRNLISNAIKFTPRDGKILISAKSKGKFVEISVNDNGIGIEHENVDKLFRIDTKIKTKGTENETGTGLGLILCKEFVVKHGGEIWAVSEFGVGSTFYFTLPNSSLSLQI